jgi:hypothetical protein
VVSVRLEIVLIFMQDRCTDCAERTIGSVIVLDTPDGTPRLHGSCGISFRSFWRQCLSRCKIGVGLRRTYHRIRNHFGHTRWYS